MLKKDRVGEAIIRTLCYADVFDYPLTRKELHRYLIYHSTTNLMRVKREIGKLLEKKSIGEQDGYIYLNKRKDIVNLRKKRKAIAQNKNMIARKIASILKLIPSIQMIALTGAVAMENASDDDDIDLMIVTSENRLWLTRLLVIPLLSTITKRRTPDVGNLNTNQSLKLKNSLCLNLFLDEASLQVPKAKQNLYTAHEVIQTKTLWRRGHTDMVFLQENKWCDKYLPNARINQYQNTSNKYPNKTQIIPGTLILNQLNAASFNLQTWYMRNRITSERVTKHSAFFHPRDTGKHILKRYNTKLSRYGITE